MLTSPKKNRVKCCLQIIGGWVPEKDHKNKFAFFQRALGWWVLLKIIAEKKFFIWCQRLISKLISDFIVTLFVLKNWCGWKSWRIGRNDYAKAVIFPSWALSTERCCKRSHKGALYSTFQLAATHKHWNNTLGILTKLRITALFINDGTYPNPTVNPQHYTIDHKNKLK